MIFILIIGNQIEVFAATNTETLPTQQDIYEALLKTKDDKLVLLSNIINWIIGIAAVIVAGTTFFIGWSYKKSIKTLKDSNHLLEKLKVREEELEEAQQKINILFDTGDYVTKVNDFEKALKTIEEKTKKYEIEIKNLKTKLEQNYQDSSKIILEGTSSLTASIEVVKPTDEQERIYKGDIYFVELEDHETRPCIIVQNDIANKFAKSITIIPMIKDKRNGKPPVMYSVEFDGEKFLVPILNLRQVHKSKIKNHIGKLNENTMKEIEEGILIHFGLDNL